MFCRWDGSNKRFADVVVALEDELILRTSPSDSKCMSSISAFFSVYLSQSFLSPFPNPLWVVPCEGARLPDPRTFGGYDRWQQPTSHSGARDRDVHCIDPSSLRISAILDSSWFWADLRLNGSGINQHYCRNCMKLQFPTNHQASVTTVFVWFLASQFLDVGGAVQLHAPPSYEHLRSTDLRFVEIEATEYHGKTHFLPYHTSNEWLSGCGVLYQGCAAPHEFSTLACQQVHANSLQAGIIWDVLVAFAAICRTRR